MRLQDYLKKEQKQEAPSVGNILYTELTKPETTFSVRRFNAAFHMFMSCVNAGGSMNEIQKTFAELEAALNAPKSRKDNYIHISELSSACPRKLYYRVTHVTPTNELQPHDGKTQMIFDIGTMLHRYIQSRLYQAGVLEEDEVRVFNKELLLTGSSDGKLRLNNKTYGLEIKSVNAFGFDKVRSKGVAMEAHLEQVSVYANELDLYPFIILYVNKNTSETYELHYDKADLKRYREEQYEKLYSILDAVDEEKPPKRVCKDPTTERALGCEYCNHCFNLK